MTIWPRIWPQRVRSAFACSSSSRTMPCVRSALRSIFKLGWAVMVYPSNSGVIDDGRAAATLLDQRGWAGEPRGEVAARAAVLVAARGLGLGRRRGLGPG